MSRVHRIRADWTLLFLLYALIVSAADAFLLERSQTFFTAGFNAGHAYGVPQLFAFFAASVLADAWLMAGICALAFPLLSRLRITEAQSLLAAWLLVLAVPLSIDFVRYRVGLVLGEVAQIPILLDVSAGALRILLSEAVTEAGPLLAAAGVALLLSAGFVHAVGRLERATGWFRAARVPRARATLALFAGLSLVAVAASLATASRAPNLYAGLAQKSSGWLLDRLIQRSTDVDLDGFGVLSIPPDPAPFDGSRHAFALDLPGNGIDENGLAGDLPVAAASLSVVAGSPFEDPTPGQDDGRRPDLLLVYLESFRADLLERERNGEPITPFLRELARVGASSERAYVHSPYTLWSRAQLFGGTLVPEYGQRTLIDDFKQRGYTVALFSGQDDSFGRSAELTGSGRADFFYDASHDKDRRTSRSANAASLQISAALVLDRVQEFLEGRASQFGAGSAGERPPLLLYVNLVDTHFPYTHDEVPDLLGVAALGRMEIGPANADNVRAAYENTAAYVDRAVRDLVASFRGMPGERERAILVAADHGQGFYERGFLGHGQALTDDQTRTPFILVGVGGEWPEPLGMADVRGLLARNLFVRSGDEPVRASFVPDRDRRLLHYMARIESPRLIALRSLQGLSSLDLSQGRLAVYDADDRLVETSEGERARALEALVHAWEATRLARQR